MSGTARSELSREAFPVRLRDYSLGGFSIICPRPLDVGVQIRLEFTAGEHLRVPFTGRVQWQIRENDTYLVGCSFLDTEGPRSLLSAIAEVERARQAKADEQEQNDSLEQPVDDGHGDVLPIHLESGQLWQLGSATFLLTASAVVIVGLLL